MPYVSDFDDSLSDNLRKALVLLIIGTLNGIFLGFVAFGMGPDAPRLKGLGCDGTPGYAIYADEEDHFPPCLIIKRND